VEIVLGSAVVNAPFLYKKIRHFNYKIQEGNCKGAAEP
jgi:hypothetical protein